MLGIRCCDRFGGPLQATTARWHPAQDIRRTAHPCPRVTVRLIGLRAWPTGGPGPLEHAGRGPYCGRIMVAGDRVSPCSQPSASHGPFLPVLYFLGEGWSFSVRSKLPHFRKALFVGACGSNRAVSVCANLSRVSIVSPCFVGAVAASQCGVQIKRRRSARRDHFYLYNLVIPMMIFSGLAVFGTSHQLAVSPALALAFSVGQSAKRSLQLGYTILI